MPLWRYAASASEATRSRWQWTWVGDDSVFKKYGEQLGLVGTWWSGQEHRVLSGIDGVLLVVVIGDGKLVVPVDFAIRRPDPTGPGAPCRDKLHWMQSMLDGRLAAFRRRGVALPPPMVVADSWFSDSKLMRHVATTHQGTFLVEGKSTYSLRAARWAAGQGPRLAAAPRLALASERAGPWGALCAAAGDQSDVWRGDPHRGQGAQGGAVLRDVSRNRHQRAAAHTGMEAAPAGSSTVFGP